MQSLDETAQGCQLVHILKCGASYNCRVLVHFRPSGGQQLLDRPNMIRQSVSIAGVMRNVSCTRQKLYHGMNRPLERPHVVGRLVLAPFTYHGAVTISRSESREGNHYLIMSVVGHTPRRKSARSDGAGRPCRAI